MTREERIKRVWMDACLDGFDPSRVIVELGGAPIYDDGDETHCDGTKVLVRVFSVQDSYEGVAEVPFGAIEALVRHLKPGSTRVAAKPLGVYYEEAAVLDVLLEGCTTV